MFAIVSAAFGEPAQQPLFTQEETPQLQQKNSLCLYQSFTERDAGTLIAVPQNQGISISLAVSEGSDFDEIWEFVDTHTASYDSKELVPITTNGDGKLRLQRKAEVFSLHHTYDFDFVYNNYSPIEEPETTTLVFKHTKLSNPSVVETIQYTITILPPDKSLDVDILALEKARMELMEKISKFDQELQNSKNIHMKIMGEPITLSTKTEKSSRHVPFSTRGELKSTLIIH